MYNCLELKIYSPLGGLNENENVTFFKISRKYYIPFNEKYKNSFAELQQQNQQSLNLIKSLFKYFAYKANKGEPVASSGTAPAEPPISKCEYLIGYSDSTPY